MPGPGDLLQEKGVPAPRGSAPRGCLVWGVPAPGSAW